MFIQGDIGIHRGQEDLLSKNVVKESERTKQFPPAFHSSQSNLFFRVTDLRRKVRAGAMTADKAKYIIRNMLERFNWPAFDEGRSFQQYSSFRACPPPREAEFSEFVQN